MIKTRILLFILRQMYAKLFVCYREILVLSLQWLLKKHTDYQRILLDLLYGLYPITS